MLDLYDTPVDAPAIVYQVRMRGEVLHEDVYPPSLNFDDVWGATEWEVWIDYPQTSHCKCLVKVDMSGFEEDRYAYSHVVETIRRVLDNNDRDGNYDRPGTRIPPVGIGDRYAARLPGVSYG